MANNQLRAFATDWPTGQESSVATSSETPRFWLAIERATKSFGLPLEPGERLFVLGANGTGKSGLLLRFYRQAFPNVVRVSALRQTWLYADTSSISRHERDSLEQNVRNSDQHANARWRDNYSQQRPSLALYELLEAENERARRIASAFDHDDTDSLKGRVGSSPVAILNTLFRLSNLEISVSIGEKERLFARRGDGATYGVAELSDGERAALLLAANVLTAPAGNLILIDEPERHLHNSIVAPLLTELFRWRDDCAFVVSTHDIALPITSPESRVLLVRGCTFNGENAVAWDADLVEPGAAIDEEVKHDILGSRRTVIFVEGSERSLDKPLYSLLFPNVSVISKSGCREVERAVFGSRATDELHWLRPFGIVDRDGRADEEVERLRTNGIYATDACSVESIYYHVEMLRRVATRLSTVTGEAASELVAAAVTRAVQVIAHHGDRMIESKVESRVRNQILEQIPNRSEIAKVRAVNLSVNVDDEAAIVRRRFDDAVHRKDLASLLCFPVHKTSALGEIADQLGFQSRAQYESAVRTLLATDTEALSFARSLFSTLVADMPSSNAAVTADR